MIAPAPYPGGDENPEWDEYEDSEPVEEDT